MTVLHPQLLSESNKYDVFSPADLITHVIISQPPLSNEVGDITIGILCYSHPIGRQSQGVSLSPLSTTPGVVAR